MRSFGHSLVRSRGARRKIRLLRYEFIVLTDFINPHLLQDGRDSLLRWAGYTVMLRQPCLRFTNRDVVLRKDVPCGIVVNCVASFACASEWV